MLEIDIDIGGLAACFGDKALEDGGDKIRIGLGDAKAVTDDRIGGGPAPLAEDIA